MDNTDITSCSPRAHEWGTAPDFVGPRHELREKLLLRLFAGAGPGRSVLNAGAGQGSFTGLLEERGFDVVSADASRSACRVLEKRVRGPVVHADINALPFDEQTFDAVVLGEVLEHVDDDVGALREVRRVLRPDGVLALSVPAHPSWFGPSDKWAGHVRRYTRHDLLAACSASGFVVVRCVGWGFPVSAAYHRWVYDKRAANLATAERLDTWSKRLGVAVLRKALLLDRLFVGTPRGALGFLLLARPHR